LVVADGSMLADDGQLAGTPSVLFDAVAVILFDEGEKALSMESAAIDFVRFAFGHFKAIAADQGGQSLLRFANIGLDAGIVHASDKRRIYYCGKDTPMGAEKSVRTLA
jgi:catalase